MYAFLISEMTMTDEQVDKARYESLREAIKKKKIAKEAAEAAAAAASAK